MPSADRSIALDPVRRASRPGIEIADATDCGRVRSRNEDACASNREIGLIIVADGVGGQGDGSWASVKAVDLTKRFVTRAARWLKPATVAAREQILARALQFAHRRLRHANLGRSDKATSGTTIVGLWAPEGVDDKATVFNVGDSRLFHLSMRGLEKISRDHSLHQLWLDGGRRGAEPSKRVIVQAIGISTPLTPHIVSFAVAAGDAVLACTDGLTGTMAPARIEDLLRGMTCAGDGARALIREALAGPAPDNITVSIGRF